MEYYISESRLKLREYGRNVQSMIEYAKTLEDKEFKTAVVHEIVRIMSNLKPSIKDIPDYKQKLWDYIYLVADYDLDVDSPYPVPTRESKETIIEEHMPYYKGRPRYRQYGKNLELMIEEAIKMEDEEKKKTYINQIANTMRLFLRNQDKDIGETVIVEHIRDLSDGRLEVNPDELVMHKLPPMPQQQKNNRNNKRGRHGKNNRRKKH
ncbi:MAG: DUF4290 domain-containing protein [Bacteroidota bacterium]